MLVYSPRFVIWMISALWRKLWSALIFALAVLLRVLRGWWKATTGVTTVISCHRHEWSLTQRGSQQMPCLDISG